MSEDTQRIEDRLNEGKSATLGTFALVIDHRKDGTVWIQCPNGEWTQVRQVVQ